MYGENTNTIAIPIYRVLPYPVITTLLSKINIHYVWNMHNMGIMHVAHALQAHTNFVYMYVCINALHVAVSVSVPHAPYR